MKDSDLFDLCMDASAGSSKNRKINFRDSADGCLRIFKYNKSAFFDRTWLKAGHEWVGKARGIVFDIKTKTVVARPFDRVEETGELDRNKKYCFENKINGFLAVLFWDGLDWRVTSSGSFESDYVDMANEALESLIKVLRVKSSDRLKKFTYMFEINHVRDPHIIIEPMAGSCCATLIGVRETAVADSQVCSPEEIDDFYMELNMLEPVGMSQIQRATWFIADGGTILDQDKSGDLMTEGFMVRDINNFGYVGKFKSRYYRTLKYLARTKRIGDYDKDGRVVGFAPLNSHVWNVESPFDQIVGLLHSGPEYLLNFVKADEQKRLEVLRFAWTFLNTKRTYDV